MTVEHIEFLVEEPSMELALQAIVPKIVDGPTFDIYVHGGKAHLLSRLPQRLRGSRSRIDNDPWYRDHCRLIVLVDRDDSDCRALKEDLERVAHGAGLTTRTRASGPAYQLANRIVVEELEAWYFGDWPAVQAAYPRVADGIPRDAKYRNPDAIAGGTWEAFERVLKRAGYHASGLRKLDAARRIAPHMSPERNTSPSFRSLRQLLMEFSRS